MLNRFFICLLLLSFSLNLYSAEDYTGDDYKVELDAPRDLKSLLEQHLEIISSKNNPRLNPREWQRLFNKAPQQIKALLETEGLFSAQVTSKLEQSPGKNIAYFTITPGPPVLVDKLDIQWQGAVSQQTDKPAQSLATLSDSWALKPGMQFKQESWTQAKRQLLTKLLVARYPNASISESQASIDPKTNTANLRIKIDSGPLVYFGEIEIEGLSRYPQKVIRNINPIKPGDEFSQTQLLVFQNRLQETGYFKSVEISADTKNIQPEANNQRAPIKIVVTEFPEIKLGLGAGYSTNTGARTQVTLNDLNFLQDGWRLSSSLRLEQKSQNILAEIRLPTTKSGFRDSMNSNLIRTEVEGQTTTSGQVGLRRAWGLRSFEQYVGTNLLAEHVKLDGIDSESNYAATLSYGLTLRRTDNNLNPTRGYLLNAQFTGAPSEQLSDGRFLQSYVRAFGYYPIGNSTQLITRAELGMVSGKNSAPATYLFRAGGDQSVRGYDFQSLGVVEGDAIAGARYLATGSIELIQWLTSQWGAAVFTDFGNAANSVKDLKPVLGYGLGARWKSPAGPIGADIAYGQETGDYRVHFNIGVAF
ncbi:MAG: outer membrane protein assembly factor [Methylotenera sp. 24-45-7]|jgi:translocation and assembly module TamA|nr:MAG: outer membrane protein assembly factor [Methylotenera sp. 24-45-7]OZA53841.1 MAG: outer membrane protein assembly factor [Methylophilales bacterium 39-45-7]HQS37363.1 autotransporter assembly complex family protein [Methylotenera sp.]HQS43526.1 autotransporter assembly complex family protein [Methylotenera sp.]